MIPSSTASLASPVIVLCGGLGTRLRPVVADVPKVLAPIGGTPYLDLLIAHLRAQGIRTVVLSTGYLADLVAAHVATRGYEGIEVTCVPEPQPLGTGGAARFAARAIGAEGAVFVLNGDTFCDASLAELAQHHAATPEAAATLALARVADASRFGTVELGSAEPGCATPVRAFREKQHGGTGWINAGVYVMEAAPLASLPVDQPASLERDLFPHLGSRLFAVPFPGARFLDIGTPDDYRRAEDLFLPPSAL